MPACAFCAFDDRGVPGAPNYRAVDPNTIVEITETAKVEYRDGLTSGTGRDYAGVRIAVHGEGRTEIGNLDRVLVVQQYSTPEMDYFNENAKPFLKDLIDKYAAAGVKLNGLYSDEMHIQAGLGLLQPPRQRRAGPALCERRPHGRLRRTLRRAVPRFREVHGLLRLRPGGHLQRRHGEGRRDARFRRIAQRDPRNRAFPARATTISCRMAWSISSRKTKHYAEEKMGHRLQARAHATWAQSPRIDKWDTGGLAHQPYQYPIHLELRLVQHRTPGCRGLLSLFQVGRFPHRRRQRYHRRRLARPQLSRHGPRLLHGHSQ